jgi:hypothetical protein
LAWLLAALSGSWQLYVAAAQQQSKAFLRAVQGCQTNLFLTI